MSQSNAAHAPAVSVIMPVHNAAAYLQEAVDSLRHQTYGDFEVVAIDDASSDSSLSILQAISDPRFRIVSNPINMGVSATRNRALAMCRGQFVAMMDADDVSLPTRFERQVAVLRTNPRCVLSCTGRVTIDEKGQPFASYYNPPSGSKVARWKLLTGNFVTASSVIARRSLLPSELFEKQFDTSEDYAAWLNLSCLGDIHVLPDKLVMYRVHGASASQARRSTQSERACSALARHLDRHYSTRFTPDSLMFWSHPTFCTDRGPGADFHDLLRWMNPLRTHFRAHLQGSARWQAYVHYLRRLALIAKVNRKHSRVLRVALRTMLTSGFAR